MSWSESLDASLLKALAHPLRTRVLELIVEREEASPVELARDLGQPLATVSHHTRVLRDLGCIELVRTERGAAPSSTSIAPSRSRSSTTRSGRGCPWPCVAA